MSVGRGLIAAGALVAAMSGAVWSRAISAPPAITAEPLNALALRAAWTLACLPYPREERAPDSLLDAYSCLDQAEPLE